MNNFVAFFWRPARKQSPIQPASAIWFSQTPNTFFWRTRLNLTPPSSSGGLRWISNSPGVYFWSRKAVSQYKHRGYWLFNVDNVWVWRSRRFTSNPTYQGSFNVSGATNLQFTATQTPGNFTVAGSTNVRFKNAYTEGTFIVNGATSVQFIIPTVYYGNFEVDGVTSVIWDFGGPPTKFQVNGQTDIVFFVYVGQKISCITGDGDTPPVVSVSNYVF
jgi:hypothetical protein